MSHAETLDAQRLGPLMPCVARQAYAFTLFFTTGVMPSPRNRPVPAARRGLVATVAQWAVHPLLEGAQLVPGPQRNLALVFVVTGGGSRILPIDEA
jgi:hypothetical protein